MLSAFSFGQMGTKVTRNKTMCKYIVFDPYNTMLKAHLNLFWHLIHNYLIFLLAFIMLHASNRCELNQNWSA